MRIDQLQQEFKFNCRYRPFPLHPETPAEGQSLEQLFGAQMDIPAAMARLTQVAESLGLPFGQRSHTYNSRNAQELGLWVADQKKFKVYVDAVYRAYFVNGINIAKPEELLKIIATIDLNVDEAKRVLQEKSYAALLDRDLESAISSGIKAVPTLKCDGRELVGFQSEEMYTAFLCDTL